VPAGRQASPSQRHRGRFPWTAHKAGNLERAAVRPQDTQHLRAVPHLEPIWQVGTGTLTLDRVESEETSTATEINFDPLVLPEGIAPSDDPLLSARSAVYSQSYTRRAGEQKQPNAITPAEVGKGE